LLYPAIGGSTRPAIVVRFMAHDPTPCSRRMPEQILEVSCVSGGARPSPQPDQAPRH
jgi:hypothetical protein